MNPAPQLPPLVEAVLEVVDQIPPGRVATYGDVAELAGCGPRQVGTVMRQYGSAVAWWRVLRADGRLVPELVPRAVPRLLAEGVPVRDGRVDLRVSRWAGPAPDAPHPADSSS